MAALAVLACAGLIALAFSVKWRAPMWLLTSLVGMVVLCLGDRASVLHCKARLETLDSPEQRRPWALKASKTVFWGDLAKSAMTSSENLEFMRRRNQ